MFLKSLIVLFSWALILEIITFFYYISSPTKPFEFYLNLFLLIFTSIFLIYFVKKEKKNLDLLEKDHKEEKDKSK